MRYDELDHYTRLAKSIRVPLHGRPFESFGSGILIGMGGNPFLMLASTRIALEIGGATPDFILSYLMECQGDPTMDHIIAASIAYLDSVKD